MIIDWKKIASILYEELRREISKLNRKPTLWVILVWDNASSLRYINQKKKSAEDLWINFELIKLSSNINEVTLLSMVEKLNNDDTISWFMIQAPLPDHIDFNKIMCSIKPEKDVDWFHPENQWKVLIWDNSGMVPCTPAWIIKIIASLEIELEWKIVTVIWRSNIVWKPIAALLINKWATVIVCNSKTKSISNYTQISDIVISATWKPGILSLDMINSNTVVIDVWFTVIWDKIFWDADFENINLVWNKITPVPWWVGSLTVAMLMNNTLKAEISRKWKI